MNTRKLLVLLIIPLLVITSCQQDGDVGLNTLPKEGFDPAIIQTLAAYNLTISDFESDAGVSKDISRGNRQSSRVAQKSISINGEVITYFETAGTGPDVLLIHGIGQSSNSFTFQLNSILGSIFHIISIDLPGHGLSQHSPNPAITYQLPGYADIVVNLIDQLNMEHAVMVGWSLGGNILLEASDRLTQARGLMILGTSPVSNPFNPMAFIPSETFSLIYKQDLSEEEIQQLAPLLFRPGIPSIPEMFYQDIRDQDPLARLFLGVMLGTANYRDEVGIVGNLSMPIAVLDGKEEQAAYIPYQQGLSIPTLWQNKVWLIPHAGHMAQWENPVYFNVLLAAFVIDSNLSS